MTTSTPTSTSKIPGSNKKIFFISFIVSVLAIFVFVSFIKYTATYQRVAVDREVMAKNPNPMKVFDVPLTEAKIAYIDLEKYADTVTGNQASSTQPDQIGCGDAVVMHTISVGEDAGIDPQDRVNFILPKLLDPTIFADFKNSEAGKKVNAYSVFDATPKTKLTLKRTQVKDGDVLVNLTGNIALGGVCDAPRVQAQLTQTIGQFFPEKTIVISVNEVPLEKVLSDK